MRRNNTNEVKLERIRREWQTKLKQLEAHYRRKEIMIKEYEKQRSRILKPSTGGMHFFKGPEGTQISSTELRKIKVDIYRNIPGKSVANQELQRDIVNPEDVVVKRRAGEGSRPIFEKEELIRAASNTEEVKEHRKVVTVKDAKENKPQTSRRRSVSLSPSKNRSYSHRGTSYRHSRHEDYKHDDRENRRSNCDRDRSRERKNRRRTQSCYVGNKEQRLRERRNHRDQSQSRERDQTKWDRGSHSSKSIRGRSGERRMSTQQIPVVEQIPIPIYYGNFLPRPFMVRPLIPIRGQAAFGDSRHLMWPIRPFGPHFPDAIDMYRLRPPGNPRGFGPRY